MAIFGRKTARQRLRSALVPMRPGLSSHKRSSPPAEPMRPGLSSRKRSSPPAEQTLTIPSFSAPADCAPWVLGGLWPAELGTATPETALLTEYLNADLQRIADSANDKLQAVSRAGLMGPARQAAETRVISTARRFAELRIDSTLRQLGDETERSREAVPARAECLDSHRAEPPTGTFAEPQVAEPGETAEQRLRRLLEFVARQEPRLRWAVGAYPDGSAVLVTDLAHGWIPAGIELPAGVRLLDPGRRRGNAAALLSDANRTENYAPGDRLEWPAELGPTEPSRQPRKLPIIDGLAGTLAAAVRRRAGLPLIVTTIAEAADPVVDAELDLLRVHLDTARYQLLAQYPDADTAVLLNCLLLAATAGIATGDEVSATYHLTWFQVLNSDDSVPADLNAVEMN